MSNQKCNGKGLIRCRSSRPYNKNILAIIGLLLAFSVLELGLALAGEYAFISKTVIIPILIIFAIFVRKFNKFVIDWSVFISLLIAFDMLRGLIYRITMYYHLPVHADYVVFFEQLFVPGNSLSNVLQQWNQSGEGFSGLEVAATIIYALHFIYFLVAGFFLWLVRREAFSRYCWAFIACAYLGLLGYLLIPTLPPYLAAKRGLIPAVTPIYGYILNAHIPRIVAVFDLNPIAAMPSIHAAFPTLVSLIYFYNYGSKAWPTALYTLAVYFSCVIVGAHFIADILAGAFLAIVVFYGVYYLLPVSRGESELDDSENTLYTRLAIAIFITVLAQTLNLFYLS